MALFKPFKGSRTSLDAQPLHDGYAYFCTDDGSFHIDYVGDDGNLQRKQINAKEAEKLTGYNIATILNASNVQIPTSQAVLTAIEDSNVVYVGNTEPTDPNIQVWVNTGEDEVETVASSQTRVTTISLPSAGWTGSSNPWSQVANIVGITSLSKVDLQPTVAQVVSLQNEDIALMTENNDGVITVYAIGGKPTVDYTMQAMISEVTPV